MQILKMDFQSQSTPPVVPVMQSDAQSRFIGIALYDGGAPYAAPENAAYTVQYHGPGPNNMGWYDTITLSSGTRKAVTVDSTNKNIITLELAEQALRVNGNVFINLCVVTSTGYMLHTFPILCRVTGAAYVDPVAVRSFFYVTGITSEQWLAYVTACQDAQNRAEAAAAAFQTDPTLSLSGKAADAAKVGEAVGQVKEDLTNLKTDTDEYIIKKIRGSIVTSKAPSIVLIYNCQINKGDKVSVKSEYDGNNIQTYDIRFYDISGNIHIIATGVSIGEEYVFTAEESYSEISLYTSIDNIVEGKKFTTTVSVYGIILNDIHDLQAKQDVQSTELTNISNKYDKEYVNILDVTKAIANKSINADTGAVVDNSTGFWLASDFIHLNANTRYYCNGIFLNGIFGFYASKDANTFVKSPAGVEVHGLSGLDYKKGYIETGSSEIYFRGSIASEMKDSAYISEWVDEYVLHQALPLKDFVHLAAEDSKLKGKKILVIGDSISTDYYGSYPKWVTALIKAHYLPLDTVNDSIHATGFVADAGTTGNDFLSRLKAVENKSSFDLVIVFGGINDYSLYKQENNISTTFTDAVDSFFEYLINNYVNARFGVIKPMLCNRPGGADDADKIRLYADYIANTAKKYAIPTLNFTDESGFNPFITQIYERWSLLPSGQELHDGIHPNEEFERKFMAPQISHFIDGLI